MCRLEQILPDSGVAALVDGEAVAVFRTYDDRVFALSNFDPFGRASVLSRGIVGTRAVRAGDGTDAVEEVPFVASPLLKQRFDLRTGVCVDDPAVVVPTRSAWVHDGVVVVGPRQGTLES